MPRIIVTNDSPSGENAVVVLDEHVQAAQLGEDRNALHFIERLGWAISDAEDAPSADARSRERPAPSAQRAALSPRRKRDRRELRGLRARQVVASLLPHAST
jgi:hypothetical protein